MAKQCKATTKAGKRCEGFAIKGSDYCLTHDPASAADRAERNRRGGYRRRIKKATEGIAAPKIESMADVLALLNYTIADIWELENGTPRGRALLAAVEDGIKTLDAAELADRVKRLEERLAKNDDDKSAS